MSVSSARPTGVQHTRRRSPPAWYPPGAVLRSARAGARRTLRVTATTLASQTVYSHTYGVNLAVTCTQEPRQQQGSWHDHDWRATSTRAPGMAFGEYRCDLCGVVWRL